jgi:alcohol dehydrogenase
LAFQPASNCAPNSFARAVTWRISGFSTPTLLRLVASRQIDAGQFGTHHFRVDDMIEAYDVFARAADTGAVKVILTR